MTRLVIATTNPDKLREIRQILTDLPIELVSLFDIPPIEAPEETGTTFEANARLKALAYEPHAQALTVAEDSGLVIDGLDGEPGVHSARYLSPHASYPERFADIARRLAERPERPRTARFVCAVAVASQGRILWETTAAIEGTIAHEPKGSAGFGYDPIFFYPPYGRTLGEVSDDEKRAVAHRGQAFRALARWLRSSATGRSARRGPAPFRE